MKSDSSLGKYRFLARKRRQQKVKKWRRVIVITILASLAVLIWIWLFKDSSVVRFVFTGSSLKSTDGRVNILLLGIGGEGHDGPYLTDSMIVVSYNLKTKRAVLFSIPRDLWLGNIKAKANAAYEIGLGKGNGLGFTEDKIDDILGIPIHYGVRIDFSGFEKAIDLVGGVDVVVPKSFDDFEYPIDGRENDLCGLTETQVDLDEITATSLGLTKGPHKVLVDSLGKVATSSATFSCRFEHIHFDSGLVHMDGRTSLKFVRSRHGTGGEGSDFARSKRQQLVLQAFREKALSLNTLTNPAKVASLLDAFGKSIDTDIPKGSLPELYSLSKKVTKVDNVVLGDLGDGKSLFVNPPPSDYGGAWVLIPPDEDLSQVADYVKKTLERN